jgi:hypothetical protein
MILQKSSHPVFRITPHEKYVKGYIVVAHKTHLHYDDVVATLPHLDTEELLYLLEALSSMLKKRIAPGKAGKHSLLELEGLGASIWSKVDVDGHVRRERDSWRN